MKVKKERRRSQKREKKEEGRRRRQKKKEKNRGRERRRKGENQETKKREKGTSIQMPSLPRRARELDEMQPPRLQLRRRELVNKGGRGGRRGLCWGGR